jgi:ABC-2 type transport system ATP-binding protein
MEPNEPVVVIHDLTKRYGEIVALDGLSLTLARGQILGLIGPNGAGKTTAIRILVGLARPSSGSAHIAGADCYREARRIKRLVGYMPDRFGSYDNMRVREYLDFFGAAFGIPGESERSASPKCWRWSTRRGCRTGLSRASATGCSSGSGWPARCSTIRKC